MNCIWCTWNLFHLQWMLPGGTKAPGTGEDIAPTTSSPIIRVDVTEADSVLNVDVSESAESTTVNLSPSLFVSFLLFSALQFTSSPSQSHSFVLESPLRTPWQ